MFNSQVCLILSFPGPCFLKYCPLCSYEVLIDLLLFKCPRIINNNVFLDVSRDPEFTNLLTLFMEIRICYLSHRLVTGLYFSIVFLKID